MVVWSAPSVPTWRLDVKSADVAVPDQRSGPTSLTRPGARTERCASCGSERVTSLEMVLTDGTPVSFCSCHDCEHRVWSDSAGSLDFADVLGRTAKRKG
jgi:DNA-directed RNA polymerase subunit M/transcription elongation factor TFIIS